MNAKLVSIFLVAAACTFPHIAIGGPIKDYVLKATLPLGIDILSLGTDGTNLLAVHSVPVGIPTTSHLAVYSTTGTLLNDFPTEAATSGRTRGVTFDGTGYLFARGTTVNDFRLYRMATNGTITGPFGPVLGQPQALSFDGTNILASYDANDQVGPPPGQLITILDVISPSSYAKLGTITVIAETGTNIASTPVTGVARHDGDLWLTYQMATQVFRFDAAGTQIQAIDVLASPSGMAIIGDDFYIADRSTLAIYKYSPVPEPATITIVVLAAAIVLPAKFRQRAIRNSGGPKVTRT